MGLPGCLFVCHLILLLMCFLFNCYFVSCFGAFRLLSFEIDQPVKLKVSMHFSYYLVSL